MFNIGIYPLLLCPFFKFANCHSLPESQGFTMLTRHRRAEVIGSMAALSPGDLVLDVGSGCGHMARWFYDPWAPWGWCDSWCWGRIGFIWDLETLLSLCSFMLIWTILFSHLGHLLMIVFVYLAVEQ